MFGTLHGKKIEQMDVAMAFLNRPVYAAELSLEKPEVRVKEQPLCKLRKLHGLNKALRMLSSCSKSTCSLKAVCC